jgi:hypothetical protein
MREFNPNYQFFPNTYQPKNPEITDPAAMGQNLEALINPDAVIKREQISQVAKASAAIKLNDIINPKLTGIVLKEKQDYEKWLMNAYVTDEQGNPKKGFARVQGLTDVQKAENVQRQEGLMQSINNMKFVQERYHKGSDDAYQAAAKELLSKDDIDKIDTEFDEKLAAAVKSGKSEDLPDMVNIVANKIQPKLDKVKSDALYKESETLVNSIKTGMSFQGYTKPTPEDVTDYIKKNYPPSGDVWQKYMKPKLAQAYGLDPTTTPDDVVVNAVANAAGSRIRTKTVPTSSQYAPGTSRNPNELSQGILPNGKRGWDLSTTGHKWDGGTLSDGTVVKNVPIQNVWVDDDGKYKMSVLVTPPKDPLDPFNTTPQPIIKITDVPGDLQATLNKKGYKLENFQQKDKTGTPAKTTKVDKTKNPNYRGTDTVKAKDKKTGAIIDFVWDDSVGNYVKK